MHDPSHSLDARFAIDRIIGDEWETLVEPLPFGLWTGPEDWVPAVQAWWDGHEAEVRQRLGQ